tara:strand:- start:2570 stop:3094 length:525 start_codon:yes stop_codon:yes gene_type:complete
MNTQNDDDAQKAFVFKKHTTSKTKARFEIERAKSNMICGETKGGAILTSLSPSFRVFIFRVLNVLSLEKIQKKQKIAFKIARARYYSKSTLSHIDQTHNLKQQRSREKERERRRREREDTTRSHDDARTRIQLFSRVTLPNHPTRTPGVDQQQQQQQQQFDFVSKTLPRSKDDE